MRETSDLYQELLRDTLHYKELMIDIAGTEYHEEDIVSAEISGGIFESPTIGMASARQLDLEVFPIGTIPRQAQIDVYVRLVKGEQKSEWIQKGRFFISTRHTDKRTGLLTIVGYDSMLMSEETWLNSSYDTANWPMTQQEAVEDIAHRMGIEIDERTVLTELFPVDYPVDENGDLTMREVLQYIAVSNCGNWIITDEGKLRLIRWGDMPEETNYLITEYGDCIVIGGDRILVG